MLIAEYKSSSAIVVVFYFKAIIHFAEKYLRTAEQPDAKLLPYARNIFQTRSPQMLLNNTGIDFT